MQWVSGSELEEGVCQCKAGVTGAVTRGITGAGVETGEGDNDESGDNWVVFIITMHALLLVVSSTVLDGSQDRLSYSSGAGKGGSVVWLISIWWMNTLRIGENDNACH